MSDSVIPRPSYVPSAADAKGAGMLPDETGIISPPRLKLCQGLTPEVIDQKAKIGDWYSDAHAASLGETCDIIPLRFEREWLRFYEDSDPEDGLMWRTTSPNDPRILELGDEEFRYRVLNCLCLAPVGRDGVQPKPIVLTFGGTSFKAGRGMYSSCRRAVDAPIQAQVYRLSSKDKTEGKNRWRVVETKFTGFAAEDDFKSAMSAYQQFASHEITPSYEKDAVKPQEHEGEAELPF